MNLNLIFFFKFTFHYETIDQENLKNFIEKINKTGMKCSIAIKPDTNVDVLYPILDDKDLVGWAECVGYLMPVTLKSILRSDVSEIYLYCVRRYLEGKKIEVPPEIKEIELSDYQQKQLKEYKQWIFKSRGGREKNLILNTLKEVFVNPPRER